MLKIFCSGCHKRIDEMKKLRTCSNCGNPVCYNCIVKGMCRTCSSISEDVNLVYDYFKDKYLGEGEVLCRTK